MCSTMGFSVKERTQCVTLLDSALAKDDVVAKVKNRLGTIAALHLGSHGRNGRSYFFKHVSAADTVEGVVKIKK